MQPQNTVITMDDLDDTHIYDFIGVSLVTNAGYPMDDKEDCCLQTVNNLYSSFTLGFCCFFCSRNGLLLTGLCC